MILRYYEADWSVPCIENELLFVGTKEECVKYLMKRWSVDFKEYENNPKLFGAFTDYLHHIQFALTTFKEKTVDEVLEKYPNWDNGEWHRIDAEKFIFNRDLIEVVDCEFGSDFDVDTYRIMDVLEMDILCEF